MESVYIIIVLPLFLLPPFFPALLSFQKNPAFSWCAGGWAASVLSCLPAVTFQASLAPGPTCLHFWWSNLSIELTPNAMFQMNPPFPVSSSPYVVIGKIRVQTILALVFKDTFCPWRSSLILLSLGPWNRHQSACEWSKIRKLWEGNWTKSLGKGLRWDYNYHRRGKS